MLGVSVIEIFCCTDFGFWNSGYQHLHAPETSAAAERRTAE